MVAQIPNRPAFVYLYFGLLRVGVIPVLDLLSHRRYEIRYFLEFTDAVVFAAPARFGKFDCTAMAEEMRRAVPALPHVLVEGTPCPQKFISLDDLPSPQHTPSDLAARSAGLDPLGPAVFQLSGGPTGLPQIIPRTHNDYVFNSRGFTAVHGMGEETDLLVVLRISRNFSPASAGIQGCPFNGGRVVLADSPKSEVAFPLIEKQRITHIELVPALLIQWLHDPKLADYDIASVRVINTGGQKLRPEVKRLAQSHFPNATVQEVLGMVEGLLCSPGLDDPEEVLSQTVGRPMCPGRKSVWSTTTAGTFQSERSGNCFAGAPASCAGITGRRNTISKPLPATVTTRAAT